VLRWCPSARSLSFRVQGRRLACGDYENLLVECPGGRKPAGYREVPTTQVGSGAGAAEFAERSAPRPAGLRFDRG
jgi:hypothetical protein